MTFNEEFMKKALKRVDELQQEMIEKSKEVPNSEAFVRVQMEDFRRTYGECNLSKSSSLDQHLDKR